MAIKKTIIKRIVTVVWIAVGIGAVVLLAAAIKRKDAQHCSGINVTIEGVDNNFFVDKKDIANTIALVVGGSVTGKAISGFDLKKLETALQNDIWVKTAQLFFDNNNKLMVKVIEREPVARVFTTTGSSFYIDSSLAMLPLSEKFSARLPVFTSFPSDKKVLSVQDSTLLRDILTVSMAIQKDSFNTAMIDQVDITGQRKFEMIPKIGNTIISFGDASNAADKFYKLQLFYREVMVKTGWNKYSEINVQYNGQVVAKRKGAEEKSADSLRTLQLMQAIAENTERMSNDSLHVIVPDNENNTTSSDLVQQSFQRDDEQEGAAVSRTVITTLPVKKPLVPGKAAVKPAGPVHPPVKKPGDKKPLTATRPTVVKPVAKPKAVLPKPTVKPTAKPAVKKVANEY